ncbi:hypothetical protein PAXRUDRAFT_832762 [Paxillus rubicundulus Ve08.2h10]|uniref:Uncharacterized protein n=1 Tax=Paxillus rubicundulus Ve08.2h10 TaxID=930991 RepID=A0A0D0DBT8_9AGAM|nr:hypothetical protein PAXRUDRAFT_832762 [Paxillus rubicundulus Ve08.2h10]
MQNICHLSASLPPAVLQLLAGMLALDVDVIQNCWATLMEHRLAPRQGYSECC